MKDKLQARIDAKNRANFLINELLPRLVAACTPFIGKKVTLQTGGFSAKFAEVLNQFRDEPRNDGERVLFTRSYGTVEVIVSVRSHDRSGEQSVSFGVLDRDTHNLKGTLTRGPFRTDYSRQEIVDARDAVKTARAALRAALWDAEYKLCGFGEYDN